MILITGGTGTLGTLLVRRLVARGLGTRVLTRDPARAEDIRSLGVDVVRGDARNRASLAAACDGVDLVISAMHGFVGPRGISPKTVDRDGNINLIEAAGHVGADFILLSMVGASPNHVMELARMKAEAEQHLRASGLSWTVVRPTAFLELWIDILQTTAKGSGRPLIFGRGDNPINFVSAVDVAALIDEVVDDQSARGLAFEIGGPQNLTFNEMAAAVQATSGRTSLPRHVPRRVLRAMAQTLGRLKPGLGRQIRGSLAMDTMPLTFDGTEVRERFPGLPCTSLDDLLETGSARGGKELA